MPITKTINFLPAVFQSETNQKFLNATLDQLVTEPNLQPINGYVGRKFAPGFKNVSTYIREPDLSRADYQLEPTVVVKDPMTGNVDFNVTYPEVLQKITYYGGTTTDQNRLWSSDYYSYNPYINLDAYINFGQYYWLPNGPAAVDVYAGSVDLEKTYYPQIDTNSQAFNFNGFGTISNPDLTFARGGTYTFNLTQIDQPFWIQTDSGLSGYQINNNNLSSREILGVTNNGDDVGTVTFTVPVKTAQDFFVNMPVVQNVDLVTTLSYATIQGQLLSTFNTNYGGIDGQRNNLNGKFIIFGQYYADDSDWTASSVTVTAAQRYGIWQLNLTASGSDFVIDLVYYTSIPVNNKVLIQSGVDYGNTQWYTNASNRLEQTPVVTANLDTLYYQNGNAAGGVGVIKLIEPGSNVIDVTTEILTKANYVSPNGVTFTNGLKIKFDTSVTPAAYQNNEYYVDGVGAMITLTAVADLIINFASSRSNFDPSLSFNTLATATINAAADQLTISTTNNPDSGNIEVGIFPNSVNSNYAIEQDITLDYPYRGGLNTQGNHESKLLETGTIGITLPGIVINGVTNGWSVPGLEGTTWHYDANTVLINGEDIYGGYPTEDGKYSYRNSNFITQDAWANVSGFSTGYFTSDGHSKLIGFAADGYPIYGPFGYLNPADNQSGVIRMRSSYAASTGAASRPAAHTVTLTSNAIATSLLTVTSTFGLNPGMRITTNSAGLPQNTYWIINNGLATATGPAAYVNGTNQITLNTNVTLYANTSITFEFVAGSFIEDYTYTPNSGTLDQYNGRFGITPEFPGGTYAYFATQNSTDTPVYPYFIGSAFYGSLSIDTNTSLTTPDYLVINRSSLDKNPWSRRNRWFHKDVIAATSLYNNIPYVVDQDYRAKRPIIEFVPNLQLYDFGKTGLQPVDLIDTSTTEPFIQVEGVTGIFIDGINLVQGMRIIFAADQDPTTRNKIWLVNFINPDGLTATPPVIHLTLADDGNVQENDTVSIFNGVVNAGKSFWYVGGVWDQGQIKSTLNQAPLFDVFDVSGVSLGDRLKYPISNNSLAFSGTKIFSYKEGTGTDDPVLGFPLTYKNFNNIGDIQFDNNFDTDTFLYTVDRVDYTDKINIGYLYQNTITDAVIKLNCWQPAVEQSKQYQDISYIFDGINNQFTIDITPTANTVVPNLLVYVNFKPVSTANYRIYNLPQNNKDIWINPLLLKDGDKVDILVYSDQVSVKGFYEIPDNLNLNAQNFTINSPTLGEMRNHIGELTQRSLNFNGTYPGTSNLRDISVVAQGGTMLQQSAPTTFASMFLSSDQYNFINSLSFAQQEYTRFKNKFLTLAATGSDTAGSDPVPVVDGIISQINGIKNKTFPWYYSDMVPYGKNRKSITYTVIDSAQRNYEITSTFSATTLSNKAVLVYLDRVQLIYGIDYTFLIDAPGIRFTDIELPLNSTINIFEYHDTDGNYIPETPTKLGLYPKFMPEIYTDYTYVSPQQFIKGHDGSLTPAFGDFRDNLLLELEKRIYNNIKVSYDSKLVNIYDSKPGKYRTTSYNIAQFNQLVSKGYLPWIGFNRLDYTTNSTFNVENAFTFNYGNALDSDGDTLPGSWRACYEYFYDTQRPDTNPWEMLGFSERPDWWVDTYGPAPYTSGNKILWDDLEAGRIASGARAGIDSNFVRPGLSAVIPVNVNGELQPPLGLLTTKYYQPDFSARWRVGQYSPTETAWRNSSDYPFAVQLICALANPAQYFAYGIATSSYRFNTDIQQYLVTDTNQRLTQADIVVNGVTVGATIDRASGYLNWIADYQTGNGITNRSLTAAFVKDYTLQLSYRMAGFTSKDNLKVLAEQNSPNSISDSVIIPDENFSLIVNKSTPVTNPTYSALIIEKTTAGFVISGYNNNDPYFTIIPPATTGKSSAVTVLDSSVKYYTSFLSFKTNLPYGTEFATLQQVASFVAGYERSLQSQGFRFDYFDSDLGAIRNWELSTKEFLFWVQQEWAVGSILVLSPFADRVKLVTQNTSIDGISNTFYGTKVMNQNFMTLDTDAYTVQRDLSDINTFRLSMDVKNGDLIAFVSLNAVQIEHSLIFDNTTQFNDIIYDPALGQRQYRLKLIGYKTGGWNGSLSAPGFVYNSTEVPDWAQDTDYLRGDLVSYKNFYYAASTDLAGTTEFSFSNWLPVDKNKIKTGLISNFATGASQSVDYYDTDLINLENKFDLFGLGLIGYRNRSYLNELGLNDTSQVKFYQGYIKEKGTRNAINALGRISLYDETSSVDINEEWAFRVGAYGSLETNQYVELVLNEDYTLNNPTSLEVAANNSVIYSSLYTSDTGLYKTASAPWNSPFLINRTATSNYAEDIQTAGFVNIEDVDYTVFDLSDLTTLNTSINSIGVGSIIWTAKDYNQSWNIFRVGATPANIIKISNTLDGKLLIDCDTFHGLSKNDTILITASAEFSGFYKIAQINTITSFTIIYNGVFSLNGFTNRTFDGGPIYKLSSQRFEYASIIADNTPLDGWRVNDKAWINYNGSNNDWAVYNKSEPWEINSALPRGVFEANGLFGATVKISNDNNFALVGQPGYLSGVGAIINYVLSFDQEFIEDISVSSVAANTIGLGSSLTTGKDIVAAGAPGSAGGRGYVFLYDRNFQGTISQLQILTPSIANADAFGTSVAISDDDQWLYVGAPNGDKVYVYGYYSDAISEIDTIAANGNVSTFTLNYTPITTELISVSGTGIDYVPFVDYNLSGSNIAFVSPPAAGSITVRQNPGYVYMDTIQSPNVGSLFGFSVATTTEGAQVIVGAPHGTAVSGNISLSRAGTISVYDRSILKFIAIAGQTLFAGISTITLVSKVYKGNDLQQLGTDYVIVAGTWIQFTVAPDAGTVVTVETDQFNLIETTHALAPQALSLFGFSVDICPNNCSIYAGAPYYNDINNNFQTGAVYRLVNQGRVYGNITGTIQNPTINSGDRIRLNDYVVQLIETDLNGVVAAINDTGVPGVTAANVGGYLSLISSSVINSNKLQVLPCTGSALIDLGLDIFAQTERIDNPTATPYDHFGYVVNIDNTSTILGVGGPDATTLQSTTFDVYANLNINSTSIYGTPYVDDSQGTKSVSPTTFDAVSTTFTDSVKSGAVWIMNYLSDARNTVEFPGQFDYIQQLTPSNLDFSLVPNVRFGSSIDINNFELLVGAAGDSSIDRNGGRVYQFNNVDQLFGWDVLRAQEPTVDIQCLIKNYIYTASDQTILYNLDYIDPVKGKILGIAEQDIAYKTDYDPAVYNNSTDPELTISPSFHWNDSQVGKVWWDLSTVRYLDYEQGSIKYRTSNWGRAFPGSSIDVYEWVESLYPPSQYVTAGGDGVPKYADNTAFVTLSYVDPATNQATVRYYFWVKDKTTISVNQFGRETPTVTIAEYIRNPKSSGVKYMAALRDDSVAVYNIIGAPTGNDLILHIDYATILNSNIIHSEYALLSESAARPENIPTNIYNKLVDSVSGIDTFGNPVPDPRLPIQSRYGIDVRPRQSMFIDKNIAVEQMVTYVNSVFANNIISQGYDLTLLNSGESVPPANSGFYSITVDTIEELDYIDIVTKPVGYQVLVYSDSTVDNLWTIYTKDRTVIDWAPNTAYKLGQVIYYATTETAYIVATAFTSGATFSSVNLSIYAGQNVWNLTRVQSYYTPEYWQYVDWYAAGFDQSLLPTFTVDTFSDMQKLRLRTGNIVKVLNNGQGKWVLMQIYPNTSLTVGIQDGTIALTDNLYLLEKYGLSFGTDNFDSNRFDQNPSIELRKILEALREDIFVNQLSQDFINLFFVFVYFVLDEQKYVDWVFKTSFINVLHKVRGLTQPQIYVNENQEYYREYIEEVKPYHTTIREYIVDYQGSDNVNGYTTDFDVPAYYDAALQIYRSPSGEFVQDAAALQQVQYKDWLLNYPYIISSIEVTNGGTGYTVAPEVIVTGSAIGNEAVARALITNGVISKIEVLYGGSNYITQPTITLTGGNGTGARAYARLANETVRKIKTTLVYDRLTYGTGVAEWAPNTAYTQGSIVAFDDVAYVVERDFTSGTSFIGNDLTFYPAENFSVANDRITAYYNPTVGMPGKDFSLLETGIAYPGATVEGPLYTDAGGFDVGGFDASAFDGLSIDVDGTFIISDSLLDTRITSSYTDSSLGTRPEDIIVDGGEYVDTYSSHAPEELIPGRVFDTLEMTVSTFATNAASASYSTWVSTTGFDIGSIVVASGGSGYTTNANLGSVVSVTITGTTGVGATAQAILDANGSITAISMISSGIGYITMPNVVITGSNTSAATASVRLNQSDYGVFEYTIFKDMNDNYSYLRYDNSAITTLAANLTFTSNTIVVANSSVLATPTPGAAIPGVVFIGGERITYYTKNDATNTLGQIRRGTAGTGAKNHLIGETVVDASQLQIIPYSNNYSGNANVDVSSVTTSGSVYTFAAGVNYIKSVLWYNSGFAPTTLIAEPFMANTVANLITTEMSIDITTDDGYVTPTDGNGLYTSTKIQAVFVRTA